MWADPGLDVDDGRTPRIDPGDAGLLIWDGDRDMARPRLLGRDIADPGLELEALPVSLPPPLSIPMSGFPIAPVAVCSEPRSSNRDDEHKYEQQSECTG